MKFEYSVEKESKDVDDLVEDVLIDNWFFFIPPRYAWDHWDDLVQNTVE